MSRSHEKSSFRKKFESGSTSADTAVFIGGPRKYTNSQDITKEFNPRKNFLKQAGWANVWDPTIDEAEYLGSGEIKIGGVNIKDINTQLDRESNGEFTVINSLPMKYAVRDVRDDEGVGNYGFTEDLLNSGVNIVNPNQLVRFAANKGWQYELFEDRIGTIPYYLNTSDYEDADEIEEELHESGLEDFPVLFAQPIVGSLGNGTGYHRKDNLIDGLREIENQPEFKGNIIQIPVPHEADTRIIAYGDTPLIGERRVGEPDTDICNLSKVDGIDEMSGEEIINQGYAEPLDRETLDPAYKRLIEDHYQVIRDVAQIGGDQIPLDGEQTEAFFGWDMMEVDPTEDHVGILGMYNECRDLDDLLFDRYQKEDGNYLIFGEVNSRPGGLVEKLAAEENPYQNGAFGMLRGAQETLAKGNKFKAPQEHEFPDFAAEEFKQYF